MGSNTEGLKETEIVSGTSNLLPCASAPLKLEHSEDFVNDIASLFNCRQYSDCTLKLGDTTFYLNKAILAARSSYFRAMLFGGWNNYATSNDPIIINDPDIDTFEFLLRYVYDGRLTLASPNADTITDILIMANRYGFTRLENDLANLLKEFICPYNVMSVLSTALSLNLEKLSESCFRTIDKYSTTVFDSADLACVGRDAMVLILKRDSFYLSEDHIFGLVRKWHEVNSKSVCGAAIKELTDCVRLPLVSNNTLFTAVRDSQLWDSDTLFEVLRIKSVAFNAGEESCKSDGCFNRKQRGLLVIEENLATGDRGATVVEGDCGPMFLSASPSNFRINDIDQYCARHDISKQACIIIKLKNRSIINHIRFLLKHWENKSLRSSHSTMSPSRSYKYVIELSEDNQSWVRVCDRERYFCRSWQDIHFSDSVSRYVKIRGTGNTGETSRFTILALGIYYSIEHPQMHSDVIAPLTNVATRESASVISGVSRVCDALIDGDWTHYDWDSGYTCHQLGSGSIIIQLAQPYYIGSCRMLLWDRDDRVYSYRIDTSIDCSDWMVAADRTTVDCSSWQILNFDPRIVVFFRITGSRNSANEVFHLVHFECPSSV